MRICGIDPGLQTTGYAVATVSDQQIDILDAGTIRAPTKGDLSRRIHSVFGDLCELLDELKVDGVVVENLYSHYSHPQTAVLMAHVRGVMLLAAAERSLPVRQYSATQIKKAVTGNGRATKAQIQRAVAAQLGLDVSPEPHDVADALAIVICDSRLRSAVLTKPAGAVDP